MFRIKDVMQTAVICTRPEMPIYDAIRLMARRNIACLPVVNADLNVVAVLSETNALQTISGSEENDTETVADYMSTDYAAFGPETNMIEICDYLINDRARLCPVVSEDQLVGVVSRSDLIRGILRVKGKENLDRS